MKRLFFLLLMCWAEIASAQYGCPDPQAINYNAIATMNDGSCMYNPTSYTLPVIDTLSNQLAEISGLVYWNGKLYAHDDSGNEPLLFEMDTTGIITKEIFLQGTVNSDWEDVTQDDQYFYIADIGNNAGDRTNLRIFKFPKNAIGISYYDTIESNQIEVIHFTYPDQLNFANNLYNTPFDCEAVAYKNGLLHLFTKNWTGGACVHYTLPTTPGTYIAERKDSINTQGTLITAADFAVNSQLMMLGYKNAGTAECSLWYIYDYGNTDSFFVKGNKRKINIGDAITLGQIEAVCFVDSSHGFIANEHFNPIAVIDIPQTLYSFSTNQWYPYTYNTSTKENNKTDIELNTLVSDNAINILFFLQEKNLINISLYSAKGKKIIERNYNLSAGNQCIKLDNLQISPGIYYVILIDQKGNKKNSKIFFQKR